MIYKEVKGDLIQLTKRGDFDCITHGCNCFCTMGAGIALPMKQNFDCHEFPMEKSGKGDKRKLGNIDFRLVHKEGMIKPVYVINSYTQYHYGKAKNIDYLALRKCMKKINLNFKEKDLGIPKIGAGLAGGDWEIIKEIIQEELKDLKSVTVVIYEK